ncbi:hypothetical protein LMTR13_26105 [Bradyrhizobium icense]|uniref:ATP-binding cassette domain-containing protein n=1 Tax=Bradyrhizobium icense TaxID=1274631 RepID=A0A1B1UJY2_9BRAD|nr:hypothetical protein LMTR13_26105 [Bradyrhizobium icense]
MVELRGIAPLLDRSPSHLFAWERQRVLIGQALWSQPRRVVMDEPLAALTAAHIVGELFKAADKHRALYPFLFPN